MQAHIWLLVGRRFGSLVDPRLEQRYLRAGQRWFLVGHPCEIRMGAFDQLHEQAVGALPRLDGRAVFAADERSGGGVETQAALLLQRTVALAALSGQERLDVAKVIHRSGTALGHNGQPGQSAEQVATDVHVWRAG